MKKLSTFTAAAAIAAIAASAALPVYAETKTNDPFVSTQFDAAGNLLPGWAIIGGVAVFVGLTALSGDEDSNTITSGSGT